MLDMTITRRGLMRGGAALLAASVPTLAGPQAEAAAARPLTLTGSTDPDFKQMVQARFPGLWQDAVFQQILPAVYLVTNPTTHRISAFTAEWTLQTGNGGFVARLQHVNQPGHLSAATSKLKKVEVNKAGKTKVPHITGQYSMIRGGETKLISPFFLWSASSYANRSTARWKRILRQDQLRTFMLDELAKSTSVSLTIPTVIYKDGYLVGNSKNRLVQYFCVARNAQHDAALQVSNLLKSGASTAKITSALQVRTNTFGITRSNWRERVYLQARARASMRYLTQVNAGDMTRLQRAVQGPLSLKKTTAKRLRS